MRATGQDARQPALIRQFLRSATSAADHPEANVAHIDLQLVAAVARSTPLWCLGRRHLGALVQARPQAFRDLMQRSMALHMPGSRKEWPELAEQYKQALPELTSPDAWRKTFEIRTASRPATAEPRRIDWALTAPARPYPCPSCHTRDADPARVPPDVTREAPRTWQNRQGTSSSSWSRLPRRARSRAISAVGTSSSPRSATSATCRQRPPRSRPSTRTSRGAASASTSTTASQPVYVVPQDKKPQITKLRSLLKEADELYLATDEDREGEAIAWHLLDELKPKVPGPPHGVPRDHPGGDRGRRSHSPRELDDDLVEAQEARRILDRLYGYEISPVLWKKVMSGLSAGRVQSVATRLVVDRERERMAFRSATYWDLEATFDAGEARPAHVPGPARRRRRAAGGPWFATSRSTGELKGPTAPVVHLDEQRAAALAEGLRDREFDVRSVESKPYRRAPYAPFRTTTLQQEASRKLGFGASRAMSVAQRLYENGHITYMRTDSVTLSDTAVTAARAQVAELYGRDYLPDRPRTYQSKVKNAQEAHEAIRPVGRTLPHAGPDRAAAATSSGSTS